MSRTWLLTLLIFLGLVAGIIAGQLLYDPSFAAHQPVDEHEHTIALQAFNFVGYAVFMNLLKMLIIPLIATSVVVGVTSVGDFRRLGRLGAWTLLYYFGTMLVAVIIGLLAVSTIKPGDILRESEPVATDYQPDEMVEVTAAGGLIGIAENLVSQMIPENIFAAMAEGQPLAVITFSIFFGVVVTLLGDSAATLRRVFEEAFQVLMKMVNAVMWIAPIGVFALMAHVVARIGLRDYGAGIGWFMVTVLGGLAFHGLIVLPAVCLIFARRNPLRLLWQMKAALMTALATDSSSATLPVTIEVATEKAGVSRRAAGFVLPLGSTINMDGTALYEAVAVVFMAQAYGVGLSMTQLIIVAVTATLAAVGAAGIPSAGLVTMVIVVQAVNQSLGEGAAVIIPMAGIGLIIGVDRLLDMVRTTVNVWGDAVGAVIIDKVNAPAGEA